MNPWIWATGALVAAVLEIVVPGAYLIWIALGAAITALAAFTFGFVLTTQLVVFIIASSAACIAGYFVYQRLIKPAAGDTPLNRRELEMIGAHGVIFEAIVNGQGKVSLGDSVWIAEGPDMPMGTAVVVTGLRGTIVVVAARRRKSMPPAINRQVILKSRPSGIPQAEHFEIVETPVPKLNDRQFLVRNEFLSVEPAMRGWVQAVANYSTPVGVGETMRSFSAGTVIASRHPGYAEGDKVMGMLGWQHYAVSNGSNVTRKVLEQDLPLSLSLGVLGLNGVTAYFALLELGLPRPGDTVVVSTAAGSVGSAVGQIAKLMGCRTVGVTGGATKVKICRDEFGYDEAHDYKAGDVAAALKAACPRGIDVYFDNTAGAISDAVLTQLAVGARIVICGTASVSSWDPPPMGPRIERHMLVKRARMSGFLVFDYAHRYEEAVARLASWVREGKLRYREDILDGIEYAPGAIAELYRGENLGKRLIRLR